jgi:exopolysaccharide biosynthesis polyprenyl glycosylphosphotransferase
VELADGGSSPVAVQGGTDMSAGSARPGADGRFGSLDRDGVTRRLLALSDLVSIALAGAVTIIVAGGRGTMLVVLAASLPAWLVVFKLYGLYERDTKRISHSSIDDLPWLFHAVLVGTLLYWGLTKALPVEALYFEEGLAFATGALVLAAGLRAAVRALLPRILGPERVLMVGTGPGAAILVRKLEQHPEYGLATVGLIRSADGVNGPAAAAADASGIPVVGRTSDLDRAIESTGAHRVVICRPEISGPAVVEMLDTCRRHSVKASILPAAADAFGPSTELDEVEGVTVFGINPCVLSRTSRLIKRGFDIAVAATLLLPAVPLYPLIAFAIKLDTPGPVLFRQTRVGRRGRRFTLLKFRTMTADAERRRGELLASSRDPNWLLLEHDPRITRVGRILRVTSLDELPQLWNVLRGEMSLVGPRPLPVEEDARVGGRERGRLDLTPGITGLWQVLGRTSIPFEEMVKLDYIYVTNWSLWMDFRLLFKTLPAVLRRRGTN